MDLQVAETMNSDLAPPQSEGEKSASLLIMGVGNYLMGDEGVGVHAAQALEHESLPPDVTVLDGGTGGFHLLEYFQRFDPLILIDATMDGKPAGTVSVLKPKFASDFPRSLGAHDIGLRDLIETSILTSGLPRIHLITISIDHIASSTTELSMPVKEAIPRVVNLVKDIVEREERGD